jgi:hypothetical protein
MSLFEKRPKPELVAGLIAKVCFVPTIAEIPMEFIPKKPFCLVNTNLDGAIPPHEADADACYSET